VRELAAPVIVIYRVDDVPERAQRVAETAPNSQSVQLEHSADVPWLKSRRLCGRFCAGSLHN
jgi:hypothetical protein